MRLPPGVWHNLYTQPSPHVAMATVGELRWAGCLTCLTQSPARLGVALGNVRQKKWWAHCVVTCLFSSFALPQANQFTLSCPAENASWLSWSESIPATARQPPLNQWKPIWWKPDLTSVCAAAPRDCTWLWKCVFFWMHQRKLIGAFDYISYAFVSNCLSLTVALPSNRYNISSH